MKKRNIIIMTICTIVIAVMIGFYIDINHRIKQQSDKFLEDVKLVYDRNVDLCMCGLEILSNYRRSLEKSGVDIQTCCKQMTTFCMNLQSKSDIIDAAELIRKDLYSKHIGKANCTQGQEVQWKCNAPIDFCLTTHIVPGEISFRD